MDNEKFIEIYARLLIISEMDINKDYHDRLIAELYRDFKISATEIDSSIAYLNTNPEMWANILEKTRDKIQEIRKEKIAEEKVPHETAPPPQSPVLRDEDKDNPRNHLLRKKPSRDKQDPRKKNRDMRE
jgi:hypothetical protein